VLNTTVLLREAGLVVELHVVQAHFVVLLLAFQVTRQFAIHTHKAALLTLFGVINLLSLLFRAVRSAGDLVKFLEALGIVDLWFVQQQGLFTVEA